MNQRSWKAPTNRIAPKAAGMRTSRLLLEFFPVVRFNPTDGLSPVSSPGVVPRLANGRPRTKPGSGVTCSVVGGDEEPEAIGTLVVFTGVVLTTGGGAPFPLG